MWLALLVSAAAATTFIALPAGAAQSRSFSSKPSIVGNASIGEPLFAVNCGTCHTLAAAGAAGMLGPNLGTVSPRLGETMIIAAISDGGASVMTKAALAKYPVPMPGFKARLSASQIDDIGAFVYDSQGRPYTPSNKSAPVTGQVPPGEMLFRQDCSMCHALSAATFCCGGSNNGLGTNGGPSFNNLRISYGLTISTVFGDTDGHEALSKKLTWRQLTTIAKYLSAVTEHNAATPTPDD